MKSVLIVSTTAKPPLSLSTCFNIYGENGHNLCEEVSLLCLNDITTSIPPSFNRKGLVISILFCLERYQLGDEEGTRRISQNDIYMCPAGTISIIPEGPEPMKLKEDLAELFRYILTESEDFTEVAEHFLNKVRTRGLLGAINHPFFWKPHQNINFIITIFNWKLKESEWKNKLIFTADGRINAKKRNEINEISYDWVEALTGERNIEGNDQISFKRVLMFLVDDSQQDEENEQEYNRKCAYDLILFFRNLYSHMNEKSKSVHNLFPGDEKYWETFSVKFPYLIIDIFELFRQSGIADYRPIEPKSVMSYA